MRQIKINNLFNNLIMSEENAGRRYFWEVEEDPAPGYEEIEREVSEEDSSEADTMFTVKTADQWTDEALMRETPEPLWKNLWHEGEVACLFADSNVGKSIYAVQIGSHIAQRKRVLYFDFELSDKQFQMRYTTPDNRKVTFGKNFLRCEIDPDLIGEGSIEDSIIRDIERVALQYKSRILIIDNITYLSGVTESPDCASRLMLNLMRLKKKYGLSILVLAHTPKRNMTSPLTQNDLAGSKKLYNFFDSVFAIGKSAKDGNIRYVKQLKVRACECTYGADNVLLNEIGYNGSFLSFIENGTGKEAEHLKTAGEETENRNRMRVLSLREEGKSIREIADALGLSRSKVGRIASSI